MIVVLIVYSCMGMQLYGSNLEEEAGRANFDNFLQAFLALFQVPGWRLLDFIEHHSCAPGAHDKFMGASNV